MRRRALLTLLLLASCASTPATLYTLEAEPGTPLPAIRSHIELRRIGLAGYLDRPDIVHSSADYRLVVAGNDRWAKSLSRMIERVLAEDLAQRLPDASVAGESGSITMEPDTIVEIDIQRFDTDATGTLILLAQIAVRRQPAHTPATTRTIRLTATLQDATTAALVAAMSASLARLADDVARMVAER